MAESTRIGQESRVTLHFALKLEDGNVVDSTFDKQPASFKVGDGNLLPGFEQALFGLKAGDKRTLSILPNRASASRIRRTCRSCRATSSRTWSWPRACW